MAIEKSNTIILHLSDLHIRNDEEEKIDRAVVLDPLLERIETDYRKGLQPELVVVTGDIAFQGIDAEYELVLPFFDDLIDVLHLDRQRLYMVPGNHDVYRKAYRPTEIPRYGTNREINAELGNADYRADLLKGMRAYCAFVKAHYPHMTSGHGDLVPFVDRIECRHGRALGLVGLNSAWMCRACKPGEDDSGRIAIGEHQVKSAIDELKDKGDSDVVMAMFHHPLRWLAPMDRQVCERYLNRTIVLAGHLHEPGGGVSHRFSGQMAHVQSGGTYLGSDDDWPSRYQYLGIDFDEGSLHFDFRAFSASKRRWIIDTETGDDAGSAKIGADFLDRSKTQRYATSGLPELPEFPEIYAVWLKENLGFLEAEKLNPRGKAPPLSLPDLFVPLNGIDPIADKADRRARSRLTERDGAKLPEGEHDEMKDPEIEVLAGKYRSLLIEGQAGCGKSTLIKHLAYTLSPATDIDPEVVELNGYLPVLILLKDLRAYCRSDMETAERTCTVGEAMLAWYLQNRLSGTLDIATVDRFARCGRVIMLVDGLDEIDRPLRDHAVNALADTLLCHPENRIVLAGRPHGLEGAPRNRFGKVATTVNDLSSGQVEQFIRQWFDYFFTGTAGTGKKIADEMLGSIQDHPGIGDLTVNPLMLTAICLLYLDRKELPDQRAELFKKFIDNMIWRRFDDPEPVLDLLKRLAFDLHTARVRMVDKCVAVKSFSAAIEPVPGEAHGTFLKRVQRRFAEIESRCGLLIDKAGQTGFWHLAFQEFLTAQHLIDTATDFHRAIADFWSDDWYKEVIELYVSYLSIDQRRTANDIVQRVIAADDESPYKGWRLAARTLVDFHHSRRDARVVDAVRDRLKTVTEKPLESAILVDAGETLGWLGDDRGLGSYAAVPGGEYALEKIGPVSIDTFEMARYPVTNGLFSRFVEDKGYVMEALWTENGKAWLRSRKVSQPGSWRDRKYRCPTQPVTGVSWYEAAAFCRWLTENDADHHYFLPSESQWQAAAAGREKREYPWGNHAPSGRCNYEESNIGRPSPVGIFADGCTPGKQDETIHDMAGNVWEWTCTSSKGNKPLSDFPYDQDLKKQQSGGLPIIKGGSWFDRDDDSRCAARFFNFFPYVRDFTIGFRCARTGK